MFATIGENHLNIPLYVLVDAQGRLRYVGNGGEGLQDLRSEIKRLIKSGRLRGDSSLQHDGDPTAL